MSLFDHIPKQEVGMNVDFSKIKFYLDIYMTTYLLTMPISAICYAAGGGEPSVVSLIIWSVLMPINFYHNEHFRETLKKMGWLREVE